MVCAVPHLTAVVGVFVDGELVGEVFLQQHVNLCREALQGLEVSIANGFCPVLQQGRHACVLLLVGPLLLLDAAHAEHTRIGQEEVVHLVDRAVHAVGEELHLVRSLLPPLVLFEFVASFDAVHLFAAIYLQPGTDDGVAHRESVGEEGRLHVLVDDVEPEGEFAEFDGGGVEVHAIDVVRGDVRLHLLQFVAVAVGLDAPVLPAALTQLLLLVGEVSLSHLVDDLVLEGGGTHGRLQYLQFQQFGGGTLAGSHLVDDALEGVFHRAACEHLGGVVGSRLLAVATVQAIDERALGQNLRLARLGVAEHLTDVEVAHATVRHEESAVLGLALLVYLYVVLLGIEPTEGEQTLIDAAQLVDTQVGITDASAVVLLLREREGTDYLLPLHVAYPDGGEVVEVLVVEQWRVDGAHTETLALSLCGVMTVGKQGEQVTDALVEEIAVAALVGVEAHHLQVAERLQRVAPAIDLVAKRQYL